MLVLLLNLYLLNCYFSVHHLQHYARSMLVKGLPIGSSYRVFDVTGEAYCEQSCELENGGCKSHQKCELVNVTCPSAPCPPVVNCRGNSNKISTQTLKAM